MDNVLHIQLYTSHNTHRCPSSVLLTAANLNFINIFNIRLYSIYIILYTDTCLSILDEFCLQGQPSLVTIRMKAAYSHRRETLAKNKSEQEQTTLNFKI